MLPYPTPMTREKGEKEGSRRTVGLDLAMHVRNQSPEHNSRREFDRFRVGILRVL